jgi:hypothetical protein
MSTTVEHQITAGSGLPLAASSVADLHIDPDTAVLPASSPATSWSKEAIITITFGIIMVLLPGIGLLYKHRSKMWMPGCFRYRRLELRITGMYVGLLQCSSELTLAQMRSWQ